MLFCLRKQILQCPHSLERTVGEVDVVGMFSGAGSLSLLTSTTPDKAVSRSAVPP